MFIQQRIILKIVIMGSKEAPLRHTSKLNQFFATAICGNDILSSALYVSGVTILFAGVYAPIVLLLIVAVLFFYKSVYTEVVEALPVNGGVYNCLLNSTTKTFAATAGVMTILSYVATAVLSGKVGVEYLASMVRIPVLPATIGLLLFFSFLVVSGIKDSAKVAYAIFIMHVATLTSFLLLGVLYYFYGHSFFGDNLGYTTMLLSQPKGIFNIKGVIPALFLAFSASLLGVSGFESSANFVEEQQKGVFRKTLRNMLIGVAIFNPLIALFVLNAMPFTAIVNAKDFLLADAAFYLGGDIFRYIVVIDAFLVLSGAVLTAFVGVSGLVYRMTTDACLPHYLAKQNSRNAYPVIVFTFFFLCSSILILTKGNLLSLAGVYTIAFLGVMSSFAFGNLLLRLTRTELKRTYRAPLIFVLLAFTATVSGIMGNIIIDPTNLLFFSIYFVPSIIVVYSVIYEDQLLKFALKLTSGIPRIHTLIEVKFNDLIHGQFVAFICNTYRLHKILDYINRNETGRNVTLIVCRSGEEHDYDKNYDEIQRTIPYLKKAGMYPDLNIALLYKNEPFGPEVIDEVSKELRIRKNRILIGSIHQHHPYEYSDLGGVRIIF